ncbi:MAG: hypothetical protein ACRD1X_13585, partial [Vicinamibacteria bacterium]
TFKVVASPGTFFEPGITVATIEIVTDGALGTFSVRPGRTRRSATLTLEEVAKSVLQKVAAANAGVSLEPRRRRR